MTDALMPNYARNDIALVRGEGVTVVDDRGRRYLDFTSGIAVTILGHCHPHLVAALQKQAGELWHTSNLYRIPGQERLAERLVAASFADAAFFCNSGAEAMEATIKAARRYQQKTGHPERYRVIAFDGAFHGRTLATLAAGGQAKHLDGFMPIVDGFDHVPIGNSNELRARITPETAALLVEPIQGEGGVMPVPADFLRELRRVADEFGLLLLMDEVQTGIGRTGKFLAHEWSGIEPDAVGLAKGLGGGFPIGACLLKRKVADVMTPGSHGSTFGGNPLAVSAANAVLDVVLADGFLGRVRQTGEILRRGLETVVAKYPLVLGSVRGIGMMLGVKCVEPAGDLVAKMTAEGLLTVPAGDNVIRFAPALVVEEPQIDEAMAIFDRVCAEMMEGKA